MVTLNFPKQTLCKVCGDIRVLAVTWPALRPPIVKRPTSAFILPSRILCMQVVVTPFDINGLLEQHLKPCL